MPPVALKEIVDPRQNPAPLVAALRDFWEFDVKAEDLAFSQDGGGGAQTVFFHKHVTKVLVPTPDKPWVSHIFHQEHKVLLGLTRELRTVGMRCEEVMGVNDVAKLLPPKRKHDLGIFVMPRIEGKTLWRLEKYAHENWLIEKLARFYIGFDHAMTNQYPREPCHKPRLSKMALGLEPLHDYIADISDLLQIAMDELQKTSGRPPKNMYNDMNPGNILIDDTSPITRVGIIDMGEFYRGDPNLSFSSLLSQRLAIYGTQGGASTFRLIDRVNQLGGPEPWADIKSCIALAPIRVANYAEILKEWAVPAHELIWTRRSIEGLKTLFDDFGLRPTLVPGHSFDTGRPTPKG